ncbi:MAG: hypothetical protein L3K00_03145 [Thermoplasmata archaeon]|nr:hypothetical protein [Thermoplasmata archaeon]
MQRGAETKGRARVWTITAAATVIAVLALLVLSGIPGAVPAAATRGGAPNAHLTPSTIATTAIYLNRSQSAGTYVGEYVAFNNTTTLHALPYVATVVASSCRWVSVINLTTTVTAPFQYVQFVNVTATLNGTASGATADAVKGAGALHSFEACGGHAYWTNFVLFSYAQYTFSFPTLGAASHATFVNYSTPGNAVVVVNSSLTLPAGGALTFKVWTNESFWLVFPKNVTGAQSCTGASGDQTCATPNWEFTSASTALPIANTSTYTKFHLYATLATGYRNWTVVYTETNATTTSGLAAFVNGLGPDWTWLVDNAWWILSLVVVLVVVVYVVSDRWGRRRGSK